jgi:hypothetical protein
VKFRKTSAGLATSWFLNWNVGHFEVVFSERADF